MSFSVLGLLVTAALLVMGILNIQEANAQVDATSSDVVATFSGSATPTADPTITPLVLATGSSTSSFSAPAPGVTTRS